MDIIIALIGLVSLVFTIIIHEVAHGYVADKLGDPTARLSGRLTLNPIPHIDPMGTVIVPLISYFSPLHLIFGWAKPVPIDPYNLKNPKKDTLLIALAGPASNLIVAILFSILIRIFPTELIFAISYTIIRFNVALAVFNLIPVSPLDGSKILVGILPDKYSRQVEFFLEKFGVILLLIVVLSPVTTAIIGPVISILINILIPTFGTI